MSSDITFYTNPLSRGRIIRWMLEEIGVPYETKLVAYGQDMKAESYTSLNPMGKVPTIVHNGQVITECSAICAYLADAFPAANLAPPLENRAAYYRWLFFAAGPLESSLTNKALGIEIPKDKEGAVGYGNFDRVIRTLKFALSQSQYIAGDNFTAADVYVGSQIFWGFQFKSLPQEQAFKDYLSKLQDREAFHRAAQLDEELGKVK